ncbi:IS607 family transposase, partial [Tolypothrix sp. VBCCA 56010]|uniref:IS607 family transposase n=1 Tax=Tolypothrix sp. VBCCA 56010 TaxID=3137731 RepID=UPI003D7D7D78
AFEFIQELAISVGCEIIVANQESLSPQQELVEDLMAIIHCFSCRLYGLRNYSKEIKDHLKAAIDKPIQDLTELDNKEIQC